MLRGMNKKLHSALAASVLALVVTISGAWAAAPAAAQASFNLSGIHGFDFLAGEWRVHHRRISAVSRKWVEFDGTLSLRLLMEGTANMEEHWLDSPDGAYRAIGLRSYDSKQDQWSAMTRTSAHWEQASSEDSGKTWQPNWIMELQRIE